MPIEGSENVPEGDGMVADHVPARVVLTGSTGTNPITDSGVRAAFSALAAAVLAFLHFEYGLISPTGIVYAEAIIVPASVLFWGFFDRFVKPRLASS